MRSRTASLILLLTALLGRRAVAQANSFVGCYALVWSDTLMRGVLPDSIRLDTQINPEFPDQRLFQVHPAPFTAGSSPQWGRVGEAWWSVEKHDSILISFGRADAAMGFLLGLGHSGDSLHGVGMFHGPRGATPRTPVTARHIACPTNAPPADSTADATFRCPESFRSADDARAALTQFMDWARSEHPAWTVRDLMVFRYTLLVDHNCWGTLEHMRAQSDSGGGA